LELTKEDIEQKIKEHTEVVQELERKKLMLIGAITQLQQLIQPKEEGEQGS
jgi:hypothetical protein